MNRTTVWRGAALATLIFWWAAAVMQASTLTGYYYSMSNSDPDVGNNQGQGAMLTTVGGGLGPHGYPVVDTGSAGGSMLHDVDSATHELLWWAPGSDSHVTVLDNPVYPSHFLLPAADYNMYTNTTILGVNGNDASSFLTAEFFGQFSLASAGSIGFNVCSDDDSFVYIAGGAFGTGTLVGDNGGIHDTTCTTGNVNTNLLSDAAAGTYTMYVFYDDREQTGATFQLSSDLALGALSPEPSSICLLALSLALGATWKLRKRGKIARVSPSAPK